MSKLRDKIIDIKTRTMIDSVEELDQLEALFKTEMGRIIGEELKFLKRMKLEFDVNICDCGEEWKDTDGADLIKERIKIIKQRIKGGLE